MKRLILFCAFGLLLAGVAPGFAQVSTSGVPVSVAVTNVAGGSAIFNANPMRKFLFCENTAAANNIYVTFGQVPTATNGYLLTPNGGWVAFPFGGCNNNPNYHGCVPEGTVRAIAIGAPTNVVCLQD